MEPHIYVQNIIPLLEYEKLHNIKNGLIDYTQIMMSYHSNRIEGSMLSLDDTASLYDTHTINSDGIIRERDINDSEGHFFMFRRMLEHLNEPLSENIIKMYHGALKTYSVYDHDKGFNIGEYKNLANSIGGLIQTVPPEDVKKEMQEWLERYRMMSDIGQNYLSLAKSHASFEHIHPFQDGNGRVGRMILYKQCLENNLVPCVIQENMSKSYKKALKEITTGKDNGILLANILEESAKQYRENTQNFIDAFIKMKQNNYSRPMRAGHKETTEPSQSHDTSQLNKPRI